MHVKSALMLGISLVLGSSICAQEERVLNVRWENDTFADLFGPYTDRHYTQGAQVSYLHYDNELAGDKRNFLGSSFLLRRLPALGAQFTRTKGGLIIGQEIYTPECLATGPPWFGVGYCPDGSALQVKDRPYAGWLYLGALFQRRGVSWEGVPVRDEFEIKIGVVGPEALGEEAQTAFHSLFKDPIEPEGWHHQLKTEPGVVLGGRRHWLFTTSHQTTGWAADLLPSMGMSLGNVATHATLGTQLRLGYNLPRDFAVPSFHRSGGANPSFGFYALAGAEGKFVAHDIFLDGNTYRSSHHVTKEPAVAELKVGVSITLFTSVEIIGAYIHRTREFDETC